MQQKVFRKCVFRGYVSGGKRTESKAQKQKNQVFRSILSSMGICFRNILTRDLKIFRHQKEMTLKDSESSEFV